MKDGHADPSPAGAPPSTVDEYLSMLSPDVREALQRVREMVISSVPGVTERISYGIIVFRLESDLVGLASQKQYCSFYTMSPGLVKAMEDELEGYEVSGATLHFGPRAPLPDTLIETILRRRLEETARRRSRPR